MDDHGQGLFVHVAKAIRRPAVASFPPRLSQGSPAYIKSNKELLPLFFSAYHGTLVAKWQ